MKSQQRNDYWREQIATKKPDNRSLSAVELFALNEDLR
jgi:hypothetical protein